VRHPKGFTLLELLVVVVIVGVMGGLAIASSLGLLQSRRFDSAVETFASAARQARQFAQNHGETYTFEFTLHDPNSNKSPDDPPDHYLLYRGSLRPKNPAWQALPEHIWIYRTSLNGPPYQWTFDERGTIAPNQMGTIVLQDDKNLDPGLEKAGSLAEYLRGKKTNPNGRSRGIIMNTYLGKMSVVTVGTL
jgi:prepilin-type N-terminal cleavage/methylation domain-containing protein